VYVPQNIKYLRNLAQVAEQLRNYVEWLPQRRRIIAALLSHVLTLLRSSRSVLRHTVTLPPQRSIIEDDRTDKN
jgi:hypothetical protein